MLVSSVPQLPCEPLLYMKENPDRKKTSSRFILHLAVLEIKSIKSISPFKTIPLFYLNPWPLRIFFKRLLDDLSNGWLEKEFMRNMTFEKSNRYDGQNKQRIGGVKSMIKLTQKPVFFFSFCSNCDLGFACHFYI